VNLGLVVWLQWNRIDGDVDIVRDIGGVSVMSDRVVNMCDCVWIGCCGLACFLSQQVPFDIAFQLVIKIMAPGTHEGVVCLADYAIDVITVTWHVVAVSHRYLRLYIHCEESRALTIAKLRTFQCVFTYTKVLPMVRRKIDGRLADQTLISKQLRPHKPTELMVRTKQSYRRGQARQRQRETRRAALNASSSSRTPLAVAPQSKPPAIQSTLMPTTELASHDPNAEEQHQAEGLTKCTAELDATPKSVNARPQQINDPGDCTSDRKDL